MNRLWPWPAIALLSVLAFLAIVSQYYDHETGLTTFLALPEDGHSYEVPALQALPHAHDVTGRGYDGQFYAQFVFDPLLTDPATDRAMDNAPYRAHRILLSWIAWGLGAGDPARSIAAYTWVNVAAWLLLACVLTAWCPPTSARGFVLWAGVLWSHGWLMSVRNALTDGPSVLLTALVVLAIDRGRPWLGAMVGGISGLARETNVLAALAFWPREWRSAKSWLYAALAVALVVLPLAIWLDYLRAIYHDNVFAGGNHIVTPFTGAAWKFARTWEALRADGLTVRTVGSGTVLISLVAQAGALLWCTRRYLTQGLGSRAWMLVAWSFLMLGICAHRVVWDGSPGAITRVTLPLTVGVNALLAAGDDVPWWLVVSANLGVIAGVMALAFGWI